ncbi:hypothetical protein [Bacillus sp. PS06]|uniref:hypothetical protein n=1 Tax=Bacillus sp. PS06 TaxID=2764176 RepID=UPI0017875A64|nr:hypothetical protein [Bacillus sp. PS06]MBD8070118.1 hypothetical protein [Bacillus sp. PS06]
MGYIMPVQLDAYTQYSNRQALHTYNYAQVSTISAVQLNSKYVEEERKHELRRFTKIQDGIKKSKVLYTNTSKYTGKGTHFNEYV